MNLSKHVVQGFVARAAAVTTNSAVASAAFNVNQSLDGWVQVYIDFTKGSLTSADFQPQLNDGLGWYDVTDPGKLNLTADAIVASGAGKSFAVNCKGAKQFRVTVLGNGTVTNSSAKILFGWQTAGGVTG